MTRLNPKRRKENRMKGEPRCDTSRCIVCERDCTDDSQMVCGIFVSHGGDVHVYGVCIECRDTLPQGEVQRVAEEKLGYAQV